MPITVVEKPSSRDADVRPGATRIDRVYAVFGSDDDAAVHSAIQAGAPGYYLGLVALGYRLTPVAGDVWEATITYGVPEATDTEGLPDGSASPPATSLGGVMSDRGQQAAAPTVSFSTGNGGTVRLTQSLGTAHAGKVAGVAGPVPDYKGAIGVNGDTVEGVEVPLKQFNWRETHYFPALLIGSAYQQALNDLSYTINQAPFRGFAAQEVLFSFAEGERRGLDNWAVTYNFSASKRLTDQVIHGSTPFTKEGWDYLWVQYEDKVDGNHLVKRPKFFYVERIYPLGDFSLLNIGA